MGKIALPAGTQWAGLNKRVDPVEITPEQSPDCANVFFYDQTLGLLGPRLGKAYAGATNYNIWGVIPYNISGQIGSLVAYGDSTSTEINLLNLYSVTTPHAGWGDITLEAPTPAIPAVAVGFYHAQALSGGATAKSDDDLDIPVNGAVRAICTNANLTINKIGSYGPGTLNIYGTFDGGVGRKLMATMSLSLGFSGSLTWVVGANTTPLVDITGSTLLTLIDAEVTGSGGADSVSIAGSVKMMGVK